MIKIFKETDRRFEENAGRVDGFRLMSDFAIIRGMETFRTAQSAVGVPTGAGSLNFDMRRLDAGEISSLYHFHRHAEELFMIVEGEATLRTPEGLQILRKGDIAFFGTGTAGAHQLYNHSPEPCIYLDVRTFLGVDIAEYPDSGRLLVVPTMERFDKSASTGYFDGEPTADEARKKFEQK
jgi:uncharacterized cupin superfamily protein